MFKQKSNAAFNNDLFSHQKIAVMHETMKRLYVAANDLLGISGQTEVANVMNMSPQRLNNWEARGMSKQGMLEAERAIGCSAVWIESGKGPMASASRLSLSSDTQSASKSAESNAEDGPMVRPSRLVPVVGEVKAGPGGYLEELEYPVGHGDGYVPSPVADESAYAVRVRGDSMSPRYRPGEFVILAPSISAQSGDDVVAIFEDGRKMLKVFGWQRDGEIQLLSINNGFEPITVPSECIRSMHVVAGTAHRASIVKFTSQEPDETQIDERRAAALMKDPRVQELLREIERHKK